MSDEAAPGPAPWLLALTLVLLAANLRVVVITVGPVLRDVQADLGMSDTAAGALFTLPLLVFGTLGFAVSGLVRRLSVNGALLVALGLIVVGTALRGVSPTTVWLLAATLVALVGIAVGNVLAPTLVRAWFPTQVGRASAWYMTAMAVGTAAPAALVVPAAEVLGGWRSALAIWAVPAVFALLAAGLVSARTRTPEAGPAVAESTASALGPRLRRQPVAWALAAFFGLQSLEAYTAIGFLPTILRDAGVPADRAGTLMASTVAIGAPIAFLLPRLATRREDQRGFVIVLIACSALGQLGLLLAPAAAPLAWVLLLGAGSGAFPLALLLITLRTSTTVGTAALSSLVQGFGYLLGVGGPVVVGALRDATGDWRVPLLVLLTLLVPKLFAGLVAARGVVVDATEG